MDTSESGLVAFNRLIAKALYGSFTTLLLNGLSSKNLETPPTGLER